MSLRAAFLTELVDHICDFIDCPADLLSMALTTKDFYNIVTSNHLPYRQIKCGINSTNLWLELSNNPFIAQKIRYLYIVPDEPKESHQSPTSRKMDDDEELARSPKQILAGNKFNTDAQQILAAAIRCMPLLRGFYWHTSDECPSSSILEALYHTQLSLDTFEILNWGNDRASRSANMDSFKFFNFSNLANFSYSGFTMCAEAEKSEETASQMVDMLTNRCPQLQSLQIYHLWAPLTIRKLFETGRWSNLRRLSVEGGPLNVNQVAFFTAHPFLEALAINNAGGCDFDFSLLKQLRSLEIDTVPKKKNLPTSVLVELRHLDIKFPYDLDLESYTDAKEILSEAHGLKSLTIRYAGSGMKPNVFKPLCENLQQVEKLAIESRWSPSAIPTRGSKRQREAAASILKGVPNLTHFSPIFPMDWAVDEGEIDFVRKALTSALKFAPKIRFVGVVGAASPKPEWVVVERDIAGAYASHHAAASIHDKKEVNPNMWGGIYYGAGEVVRNPMENPWWTSHT